MKKYTIYHNPRCSKSRQTLDILKNNGVSYNVVKYLESPPSVDEISQLLSQLNMSARELIRQGEKEYTELNLEEISINEQTLIEAMNQHPRLIERPIVTDGNKAIIGRPPEKVLDIIS